MGGKVTVSGELSKGFQKGEIPVIGCNMSVLGQYKVNQEKLADWKDYTQSLFGSAGLSALAEIEKAGTFKVKFKGHNSNFYITNLVVGGSVVGITEEELNEFCIKL
ncbi:hypothetical protein CHB7_gp11 [Enterobacteria phage CHB7]|uniref:Uncharacterized protein n=1 Tax=Enterobacteria phage CHB7 TaxID=2530182 RepID=A0A482JMH8_9CAUD|nr:hypothetical protein CHB7_gp11 [Enterobacteria phage CHB7]